MHSELVGEEELPSNNLKESFPESLTQTDSTVQQMHNLSRKNAQILQSEAVEERVLAFPQAFSGSWKQHHPKKTELSE